jgi:hypothetical protein
MENKPDQWSAIARLIQMDKQAALDDFRSHGFEPAVHSGRETMPLPGVRPVARSVYMALVASLVLVVGLAFYWMRNGSLSSESTAPAADQLLADSFLFSQAGTSNRETSVLPTLPVSNLFFTAWAESGLATAVVDIPVDPSAPVEHGDPDEVRRRIERAIDDNVFEQLLLIMREIHNKEA